MSEPTVSARENTTRWLSPRLKRVCIGACLVVAVLGVGSVVLLHSLARAFVKAPALNCANNLKQIRLAAQLWAADTHSSRMPNGLLSFTNELRGFSPKILHCPADDAHMEINSWSQFTPSNTSYVITEGDMPLEATNVFARCIHHHSAIRADGRVLLGAAPNSEDKR